MESRGKVIIDLRYEGFKYFLKGETYLSYVLRERVLAVNGYLYEFMFLHENIV